MYWDISFIFKKSIVTRKEFFNFLEQEYQLVEGENEISFLGKRKILVFLIKWDEGRRDFDEICVDFYNQIFHEETFHDTLKPFTDFVNHCFKCNPNLEYAFSSYESNGYLISRVRKIKDMENDVFLKEFPILYKRKANLELPYLEMHLEAQNIFE